MPEALTTYLSGRRAGWFSGDNSATARFQFDAAWVAGARRAELSQSMPKSAGVHTGPVPWNWLWGLLPDSDAVLQRWGRKFGVSSRNPLALLRHVGLDAAGAVQLSEVDEPVLPIAGGIDLIDTSAIADQIRELRRDATAWLVPREHAGHFSLAGAQAKFALAWTPEGWGVPVGRAPSTHIFKPGIQGLAHSDLGEHLALDAASRLGISAVRSRLMQFEDETAIVVERYDRELSDDGHVGRIHQEDLTQASGLHPINKYQSDGGPGIASIAGLLRSAARTRPAGDEQVARFFEANLFNCIIAGTDAHAKNYSILQRQDGTELAPLYDVQSILGREAVHEREVKLAMSFNGHYRTWEIRPEDIEAQAREIRLEPGQAIARVRQIADLAPDAFADAARVAMASTSAPANSA